MSVPADSIDVTKWLPLVCRIALRMGAKYPVEDSEQYSVGVLGLLAAARGFDASRGKFMTYAHRCIVNAILEDRRRFKKSMPAIGTQAITWAARESDEYDSVIDHRRPEWSIEADDILRYLDDRSKYVLKACVFDRRAADIADELGVSRSRVSEICRKAIHRLQRVLGIDARQDTEGFGS